MEKIETIYIRNPKRINNPLPSLNGYITIKDNLILDYKTFYQDTHSFEEIIKILQDFEENYLDCSYEVIVEDHYDPGVGYFLLKGWRKITAAEKTEIQKLHEELEKEMKIMQEKQIEAAKKLLEKAGEL